MNIIAREQDGRLVLIDFGAVKDQVNTELAKKYSKTALTEFAVGTMGFAPPEQLAMRPIYSSDIYAVGATCLYLMTGKSPREFPADELTGELRWRQEVSISGTLEKVLSKMLEVDIRYRYQSADEVLNDLDIFPYEDQLQGGLLNPNQGGSGDPSDNLDEDSTDRTSNNTHVSATTRLAMAIRARKTRRGKMNYAKAMMTPESFMNAYKKGRRDFSKQNFNAFNLSSTNIPSVNFNGCQMSNTVFEETNLQDANFYSANLANCNFNKAYLKNAYFFKANLQSADLRNTNLKGANFEGANLNETNLCGANLTGANITDEQLEEASTNWGTIFPDGKRRIW